MSDKLIFFAATFCLLNFNIINSQNISVDNTYTAQQLIENNLVEGCVEVSNITSQVNGSVNGFSSFGYFEKDASNFPFEDGIVLTTGNANSGGNAINTTTLNEGEPNWGTDSDLEAAIGVTNTLNATSIEFDLVSISNLIQFNYILASEEYYANFPCLYSDGFAFLIKQAGTNDPYTNIALIPGTSIPVNTNTIHDEIAGFCEAQNETYFEGYNIGDTNYNGRTTVLTATASIIPYVTYHIKLVIADQLDENYDSAVFIEGNSLNPVVDLGPDITTCAVSHLINGDILSPLASYSWFQDGTLLNGETNPSLTVTTSGDYRVEISIPLNNLDCVIEDTVSISLSATQTAAPITNYELCDDVSADLIETFDLLTKNIEVLASVPASTYSISYHMSASDAQNNNNAITTPIQNTSNPQAIFIRIEDTNTGCLAFSTFNLIVIPLPNITQPTDLEVCDDFIADGSTEIDLTQKDDEIINGQNNLAVTYHNTQIDANTGSNPIAMPYTNTSTTEQIFVSVLNLQTGCISTTVLTITVLANPVINMENHYIDACDPEHDGFASFDLTTIIAEILEGLTGVTVSFYESNSDALAGTNPIADETNYNNTDIDEQFIFIRVVDDISGCFSVSIIEIHSNLLLTGTNIRDFPLCDIDNNGIQEFNLAAIATTIMNDLPDVTIVFYETENDRDNQTNPIDTSVPYIATSNPQTIYLTLNNLSCSEYEEINLVTTSVAEFDPIAPVAFCDTDQDGFTSIDLSTLDIQVTNGISGYTVTYYETQADADANTNALPILYTNISSPQTLFTRIQSNSTGCTVLNSFEISVLPAPLLNTPANIIICDDDQDAYTILNLDAIIPEIIANTNGYVVSFHNTQSEATNGTNAISGTTSYNSTTETIFIRVENNVTSCFSIVALLVFVNTPPVFVAISDFENCETDGNQTADFLFVLKDDEILNGQTGKQVLYFETQSDAINRTNIIDKNAIYTNTFSPQTIYVRVENIIDQDCYGISTFLLKIGSVPLFNRPTDFSVCDDISNDGVEVFDLNDKIIEMSQGIPENLTISFYTSLNDAENELNPLDLSYTNSGNPQLIYARIENETVCHTVTTFSLNVVLVPEVNLPSPITVCDTDYDGSAVFDLTVAVFEILDVRQDDIVISYFETLEDLDNQTNEILTPEAYSNISNPQTVYVRVTNTVSNCYVAVPLELLVNLPPAINDFAVIEICDSENNTYDLSQIDAIILVNTANVLVDYYPTQLDALNQTNALNNPYTYQSNNNILYARIEFSTTHCYHIYEFQLQVNPLPIANPPNDLTVCDDDFDNFYEFDLTQQTATVLGNQNPNSFTVTYYADVVSANEGINDLGDSYPAMSNEVIYVRIENNLTSCYSITQFTTLVYPKPVVDIPDQIICLDNLPLLVSANTNNDGDTYLWSTNETTPEIEISDIGTYYVTVTSPEGCETLVTFNVEESEPATIEIAESVDFSDPNNIIVTISGIGNYLYILDDGEPQESNIFENVSLGYHIITVIDLNGCDEITEEIVVVDAPKFMTPNNDGYFDTWHITGVETLPGTIIYIFDRYGKLITQLSSNSAGWDGTYNGKKMPANDYWFLANVRKDGISFEVQGHFALRR